MSTQTTVKINRTTFSLLIGSWILFVILFRGCSGGVSPGMSSNCITKTTIKVVKQEKIKYLPTKPQIVYKETPSKTEIDSIPYTDSTYCKEMAIEMLTENYYNDTIQDDTCLIHYQAKVKGNKIDSISFGYQVKVPFQTITQEVCKPRVQVFLTGNVGGAINIKNQNVSAFAAGPEFIIKDKKNFLYGASSSWSTTGDVYVMAKFGFMLSFKKNR